jgi:aminoglycoside phosphotransferase family enzyme/predicted kinase
MPITERQDLLRLNAQGKVVDYCVKMQQFSQQCLIKTRLQAHTLTLTHINQLADQLAEFHDSIPQASASQIFGNVDEVIKPIKQNFATLRPIISDQDDINLLKTIEQQSLDNYIKLKPIFQQRKNKGFIRECHGDLHLGNIAIVDEKILIFDCIEFNESFRWIDTMSELAFLLMDLQDQQQDEFASHLLNRYLEKTGDYDGLIIIRFYMSYRAMVRAKVCGLQLEQQDKTSPDGHMNLLAMRTYLKLAVDYNKPSSTFILITHGVSGSGKSWISSKLADRTSAIHIRSDVERKRLYKDKPEEIYQNDATIVTYQHLLELTKNIISCHYPAIIDATFLQKKWRKKFARLAKENNIPYHILSCQADNEVIQQRINQRSHERDNVSDATIDVMRQQLKHLDPIDRHENQFVIKLDTTGTINIDSLEEKLV